MKKASNLLLIFILILSFNCEGQSFLGKDKHEVFKDLKEKNIDYVSERANEKLSIIKINHSKETMYLVFVDDVCSEQILSKPYNLQDFSSEVLAYDESCEKIGKLKWRSKDNSKIYDITVNQTDYSVSTVMNY